MVDVLNRFYPAWRSTVDPATNSWVDPDHRQQMEHARHLAKYVFPRQYGLKNAFTVGPLGRYGSFWVTNYLDREQEIKVRDEIPLLWLFLRKRS